MLKKEKTEIINLLKNRIPELTSIEFQLDHNKHYKIYLETKDNTGILVISGSPSDYRERHNLICNAKRAISK